MSKKHDPTPQLPGAPPGGAAIAPTRSMEWKWQVAKNSCRASTDMRTTDIPTDTQPTCYTMSISKIIKKIFWNVATR